MSEVALVFLGFFVGSFGTLIGVGGGFLLIPIFLLVLHYSPQQAIGTSLAIVFLNALSGTLAYIKQKKVFYDAGIRFSLSTLPGAIIGGYLASSFTGRIFSVVFGGLLIVVSLVMLGRTLSCTIEEGNFDKTTFTYNRSLGIMLSLCVGFLSSVLGIGGGIIHVPILVYLLGFPCHIATATSHFILAFSTLFGFVTHMLLGNVLLAPAISIGFGAIIGAQFGAYLSLRVPSRPIVMMLAIALSVLGVRLILK
jgi:uncharacterized membrane protein YfcA